MARYDEVGGLVLRRALGHGAGLFRRHRLLNVKVDLIAAGLAGALESGAQKSLRSDRLCGSRRTWR
jgi:hypothetical protein